MKKSLLFSVASACLLLATAANAQFGGLGAPAAPGGGGGATPADIDAFLSAATNADKLVNDAAKDLFSAVAGKEEKDKYEATVKAASTIADPKEKQAKLDEAQKSIFTSLQQTNFKAKGDEMAKKADQKQKAATGAAIWNLVLGGLKDAELVITGKKLVSGVPSPAIAGKIPEVKASIEKLGAQVDALPKVVEGAKNLMKTVGLDALPLKASDAPKSSAM